MVVKKILMGIMLFCVVLVMMLSVYVTGQVEKAGRLTDGKCFACEELKKKRSNKGVTKTHGQHMTFDRHKRKMGDW